MEGWNGSHGVLALPNAAMLFVRMHGRAARAPRLAYPKESALLQASREKRPLAGLVEGT